MPDPAAPYVVFYDGVCVLCHQGMGLLMKLDRRGVLHYAPLQGDTARAAGVGWDDVASTASPSTSPGNQTVVFWDRSGAKPVIYERMRAVRAALDVVDRWPVARFLLRVIPLPISNLAYRLVAATRYRIFGTYDVCPMPPEAARSRFLP